MIRRFAREQRGPIERKSLEPIADAEGIAPRALDKHQRRVAAERGGADGILVMDETSDATQHRVRAHWDIACFRQDVLRNQARRLRVYEALRQGHNYTPWGFRPIQIASERFMRNHLDLNVLETNARLPGKAD